MRGVGRSGSPARSSNRPPSVSPCRLQAGAAAAGLGGPVVRDAEDLQQLLAPVPIPSPATPGHGYEATSGRSARRRSRGSEPTSIGHYRLRAEPFLRARPASTPGERERSETPRPPKLPAPAFGGPRTVHLVRRHPGLGCAAGKTRCPGLGGGKPRPLRPGAGRRPERSLGGPGRPASS